MKKLIVNLIIVNLRYLIILKIHILKIFLQHMKYVYKQNNQDFRLKLKGREFLGHCKLYIQIYEDPLLHRTVKHIT